MDAWIVSTKNTVSNNQPHHLHKVEQKQLQIEVVFFIAFMSVIDDDFKCSSTRNTSLSSPATFMPPIHKKAYHTSSNA